MPRATMHLGTACRTVSGPMYDVEQVPWKSRRGTYLLVRQAQQAVPAFSAPWQTLTGIGFHTL